MCLIGIAYQVHLRYPIVIAANRDEFYQRRTARADWWSDRPDLLGGRDLEAGGTWMAVHRDGRFGCVTNYRDFRQPLLQDAPSRGELIPEFLDAQTDAPTYLEQLDQRAEAYNGFNLLLYDGQGLFHYSNQEKHINALAPGVHGLSNHLLDTPWPKVSALRQTLHQQLSSPELSTEGLFASLDNRQTAPDHQLPDTGVSLALERTLSAMFIQSEGYGTRVSTVLLVDSEGKMYFEERSFVPSGPPRIFQWETATQNI